MKITYDEASYILAESLNALASINMVRELYKRTILQNGYNRICYRLTVYLAKIDYEVINNDIECRIELDECGSAFILYLFRELEFTQYPELARFYYEFTNLHDKIYST